MRLSASIKLTALLCVIALSGCVSLGFRSTEGGPENYEAWRERVEELRKLRDWKLKASISVSGSATENAVGKMNWSQKDERYKLTLRGPFGAGAVKFTGGLHGVTVKSKEGERYFDQPQVVLREVLGWDVPLTSLRYWVLGRPAPHGIAKMDINQLGQLRSIRQNGWTVEFFGYDRFGGHELPDRVLAKREGVEVKVAISDWTVSL